MKRDDKNFLDIGIRYVALLFLSIFGVGIFYKLFLKLTIYPTYWMLNLFYLPVLGVDTIYIGYKTIEIIGACIAGSAYLFLLILNLSTSDIEIKKRLKLVVFSFGIFFLVNLFRIILLSFLYLEGVSNFDLYHELFWYLGSTIFVVAIWFSGLIKYKIYKRPFYDDLKFMISKSIFKKYFSKK